MNDSEAQPTQILDYHAYAENFGSSLGEVNDSGCLPGYLYFDSEFEFSLCQTSNPDELRTVLHYSVPLSHWEVQYADGDHATLADNGLGKYQLNSPDKPRIIEDEQWRPAADCRLADGRRVEYLVRDEPTRSSPRDPTCKALFVVQSPRI